MADDLPTSDELGAPTPGDRNQRNAHADEGFAPEFDFDGTGLESDLQLDKSGFEPGLELDKSGFDPKPKPADPEPVADGLELDTAGFELGLELDKSGFEPEPPGPAPDASALGPQAGPRSAPSPPPRPPPVRPPGPQTVAETPSPRALRALAVGVAVLFAVILAATLFSDPAPPPNPIPQQTLEEGERAFHQGKWVEALEAFHRLRRFPNTAEAKAVRDRGLEERAFNEIMQAEPSSATIRRLEELSELYPDRLEVRDRLGDVRKALSSGARAVPEEQGENADPD